MIYMCVCIFSIHLFNYIYQVYFFSYINFHLIGRELVNAIIHWFLRNFSVMSIYKRIKVFLIFSRIDQREKKMFLFAVVSIPDSNWRPRDHVRLSPPIQHVAY